MVLVQINNLSDFELDHIFECGQCFRWKKEIDRSYTGVTKFGVINIKKEKNSIIVDGNFNGETEENVLTFLTDYLDLLCNYSEIKKLLSEGDNNLQKAMEYGYGIRILNQDPWEMLISYIISAANNIPRISKTIENISKEYGQKIEYKGKDYYLFPTPQALSKASIEDLRRLNLGFRDKYVYNATKLVISNEVNLNEIMMMDYQAAKKALTQIDGVGDKVANCILLFSMKKTEAFPVDTWIKKVMSELYNESKDIKKIATFAEKKFGKYGGIAQQYLFYYMRSNN